MELTYRARRKLKRGIITGIIVALVLTLVWVCWLVWVERYVSYTRDGAVIDFSLDQQYFGEGTLALPPAEGEPVSIYYNDGSDVIGVDLSLRQMGGYSITTDMLTNDLETVRATISALPVGSTVLMEVKNIKGQFYYGTQITDAPLATNVDTTAVDDLIEDLASRNLYLVASVPAFRDRNYGLHNTSIGIPFIGGGGALWLDSSNCYWLDPAKARTLDYLAKIANELRMRGFNEVLFTDFCFPESNELDYSGDKATAIQTAAEKLVDSCAKERFAVSFLATGSTVQSVAGRSRLYFTGVEGDQAADVAARYTPENPAAQLVFLTDSYDTRFDEYCVLRPLSTMMPQ